MDVTAYIGSLAKKRSAVDKKTLMELQTVCDEQAQNKYDCDEVYQEITEISKALEKAVDQYTHYASQCLPAARACKALLNGKTSVYLSMPPG